MLIYNCPSANSGYGGWGEWDGGGGDDGGGGGGGGSIGPGNPTYDAHLNRAVKVFTEYAKSIGFNDLETSDVIGWVNHNACSFSGGNLNIYFNDNADQDLLAQLNEELRWEFTHSLHVITNKEGEFSHFHIDTFSPDGGLGYIVLHGFWDVFIGTLFFNRTGLPCVGC